MAMTLEQVRNQIAAVATGEDYMLQGWIAAIDTHLTQPAQAVDVGIIREVAASIDLRAETYLDPQAKAWANTLTLAIAAPPSNPPTTSAIGENGK